MYVSIVWLSVHILRKRSTRARAHMLQMYLVDWLGTG